MNGMHEAEGSKWIVPQTNSVHSVAIQKGSSEVVRQTTPPMFKCLMLCKGSTQIDYLSEVNSSL